MGSYSATGIEKIPALTACNLTISLLALPTVVLLTQVSGADVSPVVEIALSWMVTASVIGIAVLIEGRSLTEVGFRRPTWHDTGYTVVTAAAALFVFIVTDPVVEGLGLPVEGDIGTMSAEVGLGIALAGAVTTGVVEEILFRGYPIESLLEYTDSWLVAGGFTWGVFTAAHAPTWPIGNLVQIAAVAGVFTVVYLRRRTLFPVIGAHVMVWTLPVMGQVYG